MAPDAPNIHPKPARYPPTRNLPPKINPVPRDLDTPAFRMCRLDGVEELSSILDNDSIRSGIVGRTSDERAPKAGSNRFKKHQ